MTKRIVDESLLKQALDALEAHADIGIRSEKAITALRSALDGDAVQPVAWRPISTAPKARIVLVHYKNRLGNGRTMRARYYLPETLDSDTTESGWADEGWYEESEAYEYLMPLDGEPTHWMPLPAEPGAAPQPAQKVEPVAFRHMHEDGWEYYDAPTGEDCDGCQALYTAPQPAQN